MLDVSKNVDFGRKRKLDVTGSSCIDTICEGNSLIDGLSQKDVTEGKKSVETKGYDKPTTEKTGDGVVDDVNATVDGSEISCIGKPACVVNRKAGQTTLQNEGLKQI